MKETNQDSRRAVGRSCSVVFHCTGTRRTGILKQQRDFNLKIVLENVRKFQVNVHAANLQKEKQIFTFVQLFISKLHRGAKTHQ